ncbi:MAG TPA: hypothetical protein VJH23_02910 [archaeon]|nr:hypothetical protein [archaeon]
MEFSKEFQILPPTSEEIIAAQKLLETDSEFLTDRELWILSNYFEEGDWE